MISGKLIWLIVVQFTIFKGSCCNNSTQKTTEKSAALLNVTSPLMKTSSSKEPVSSTETNRRATELPAIPTEKTTLNEPPSITSLSVSQTQLEIVEIFQEKPDNSTSTIKPAKQSNKSDTVIKNCLNEGSENLTRVEQLWNDTLQTNYSTMAESIGYSEDTPDFRLSDSAAIAAGVFLISAVLGYVCCVGYRRYLQRKYGNVQMVIGEEVYDTTDLRNFEI